VPRALDRLRRAGLRRVVVSNWDVSLHGVLCRTGLRRLLSGAITSAELGAGKPSPAPFRHALTLAGVPARDAVMVGNSVAEDVEGARAAGVEAILLVRDGAAPGRGELDGVRTPRPPTSPLAHGAPRARSLAAREHGPWPRPTPTEVRASMAPITLQPTL
jgi:putative hydrolase of the HAD superfamily